MRTHIQTPLGWVRAEMHALSLTRLDFQDTIRNREDIALSEEAGAFMLQLKKELDEYFLGRRCKFTIPIRFSGTAFQEAVWKALQTIPYGETRSYGDIAKQIGNPKAARAVGSACNKNPLVLLVPCHRVIGKNGALTGFGCGLSRKAALLELEKKERPVTARSL